MLMSFDFQVDQIYSKHSDSSEKIFLQPIDQNYEINNQIDYDDLNYNQSFLEDYEHRSSIKSMLH